MEGKHEAADVVLDIQDLWVEYIVQFVGNISNIANSKMGLSFR